MPSARPLRPDSIGYQNGFQDHIVKCVDCDKFWRFGCDECADHHGEYHRDAFPGHDVTVRHHVSMGLDWPPVQPRRRQRNSSTQALFGRRSL